MQSDGFCQANYKEKGAKRGRKRKAVSLRLHEKDPRKTSSLMPWCVKCSQPVYTKDIIHIRDYHRLKYQQDALYRKAKKLRGTLHYHKTKCKQFILENLVSTPLEAECNDSSETHPSPLEPPPPDRDWETR